MLKIFKLKLIAKIFNDFRNHPDLVEAGHSLSSGDLMSTNHKKDTTEAISRWNPFEDSNFCQSVVTEEEDLFGAEFDKIRQEGMFLKYLTDFKNLNFARKYF